VRPADAWIDPSQPKDRAWVTHGHSDHARGGHGAVLATPETLAIMGTRYGPQPGGQTIEYDETIRVGEVDVRFVPAGHVLGSAQIVMEHKGERIVVSGDYKRRPDPTCPCFVPVPCDIFITEATFGLPVFRHPHRKRNRPAAASPPFGPVALRSGRRLRSRQGAAYHHRASGARPQ